jgi:Spy/CpxP family protein refolding chaperone
MKPPIYRLTERPMRLVAVTLALALAGGLALSADAVAPPPDMMGGPMMMGPPGHMQHMLDAVNATADQRSQIKTIMDAAHADLKVQHEAGRALHEQSMQLFTQTTVDARAAEALRQQMLAQHDQASKRMLQAMLDISRVLTPEQRQQIAANMTQREAAMQTRRAARAAQAKPAAQ